MLLQDHHAVITGGGSGIGAAIAQSFAAHGARLTLIGRRRDRLEATAAGIGATFAVADVTSVSEIAQAFDIARAAHGPISILVANAGAAQSAPFAATTSELWQAMIATNLTSVFNCMQACLADIRQSADGRIIAVASTAALRGYAYSSAYAAAKHGVLGLIRSLALELAKTSATANAICPGFCDTEIVARAVENISAKTGQSASDAVALLARFNPQNRLVAPAEVAAAAVWLCQRSSTSITGQAISISGGETM